MADLNNEEIVEIKKTDEMNLKNKDSKKEPSFIKSLIIDVLVAAGLAFVIISIVRPTIVKQTSMLETMQPNDYVIMYKLAYAGDKTPQRGDIVIFQSDLVNEETGGNKLLIKRVIGLPGDKIMIKRDQLFLNGELYPEDYIKDGYTPAGNNPYDGETFTVPEGEYYCMGDNRVVSLDSRYTEVGTISEDKIVGKAVLRLFPFNKIQKF